MDLKKQVVPLELARRLKELGVPQTAEFSWFDTVDRDDTPRLNWTDESRTDMGRLPWEEKYSAFTSSEIGEMLPKGFCTSAKGMVSDAREDDEPEIPIVLAKTETDGRAKMLIHLIEKGVIATKSL